MFGYVQIFLQIVINHTPSDHLSIPLVSFDMLMLSSIKSFHLSLHIAIYKRKRPYDLVKSTIL